MKRRIDFKKYFIRFIGALCILAAAVLIFLGAGVQIEGIKSKEFRSAYDMVEELFEEKEKWLLNAIEDGDRIEDDLIDSDLPSEKKEIAELFDDLKDIAEDTLDRDITLKEVTVLAWQAPRFVGVMENLLQTEHVLNDMLAFRVRIGAEYYGRDQIREALTTAEEYFGYVRLGSYVVLALAALFGLLVVLSMVGHMCNKGRWGKYVLLVLVILGTVGGYVGLPMVSGLLQEAVSGIPVVEGMSLVLGYTPIIAIGLLVVPVVLDIVDKKRQRREAMHGEIFDVKMPIPEVAPVQQCERASMERFVRPEKVEIPPVYYDAEIPEVETEVMEEPAEPEVMAAPEPEIPEEPEIPAEPEISAAWEVEPEMAAEPEQPVEPAAEPKPPVGAAAASAAKAGFKKVQQYTNQARKKVDGAKLKNNLRKIFRKPTRKLSRKGMIALGAAAGAAVAALVILIICLAGNSYKTPVRTMERADNSRTYSYGYDNKLDHLNGLLKKETKELYEILEESDAFMELMEEFAEAYEESVEDMEDEYGKNYKYSYKITEKEELKRKELRAFRDSMRAEGEMYAALDEETEDYENEDWEDLADMLDLSRSKTKSLVRKIVAMGKELKKADVTEGYELTVEVKLTGKELDEPEEDEVTVYVYKVNGRWIAQNGVMAVRTIYAIIGELS